MQRIVLITGAANDIGAMGRFATNVIIFVLNNSGYLIERALEENPNWTYNDLAPWSTLNCLRRSVAPTGSPRSVKSACASKSGGLHRNHRRQDGQAAGSCLHAGPAEGYVRRHRIIHPDRKNRWREKISSRHPQFCVDS
jgi:hypothetical protein